MSEWVHAVTGLLLGALGAWALGPRRRRSRADDPDLARIVDTLDGFIYRCDNDRHWTVMYMSRGVEALTGYPAQEFLSTSCNWGALIHPDDAELVWSRVQDALAKQLDYELSYRIKARNGECRWVYERGRGVFDAKGQLTHLDGHVMDDTVRMRALEAQRQSERQLRDVLDSMFAFVALLSVEGDILDANRAPLEVAGLSRDEVVGKKLWQTPFFSGAREATALTMDAIRRASAGETVRRDLSLRLSADRHIIVDAAFGPVRDVTGKIVRVVGSCVDVTEQREAEQKRQKLEAQLRQAQKLDALGTLVGGIAHDFNNVLTAILGNVELAKLRHVRGAPVGDAIDEIAKAGRRAQDLVQRILAFSSRQEQSLAPTRIVAVVDEVLKLLRPTLPACVEVVLRPGGERLEALADSSQVHQVIVNLVTNAWHALGERPGQIEVSVVLEQVNGQREGLQAELAPGNYVRVDVRDDGSGMDAATLERVFEPFFTTKPRGRGTGLGLSVVHGIMRAHGGSVLVDSELGRGTTVHLFFPAVDDRVVSEKPPTRAQRVTGQGEHVLFVDDEPALVAIARSLLSNLGYRVTCHTSGEQALATFAHGPEHFDVVVTDYSMSGMTGVELAGRVLAIRPDVRVIVISGFLTPQQLEAARELGVAEVMMKPVSFDRLSAVISEQLGRAREAGQHASDVGVG